MAKFAIGCMCLIVLIVVGMPCAIIAIFWFRSIPSDISSEARYFEIYNKKFEVQNQLFLHQWPDSKHFYLKKYDGDIATVEPGTRLRVKKNHQRPRFCYNTRNYFGRHRQPQFFTV